MQGLKPRTSFIRAQSDGSVKLANLRKSVLWSSPPQSHLDHDNERTEALQDRLEELLVFELRKDGGRQFLHLSTRGLYKRALEAITSRDGIRRESKRDALHGVAEDAAMDDLPSEMDKTMSSALPLGNALIAPASLDKGISDKYQQTQRSRFKTSRGSSRMSVATPGGPHGEEEGVTYRERLGGYLHPRDMRRLVTPFSASNEPQVLVRRHAILLNFDPLRAIVLRDRLLVLVPDGADSILSHLESRVRGGSDAVETSVFGARHSDMGSSTHSSGGGQKSLSAHKPPKTNLLSGLIRGSAVVNKNGIGLGDDPGKIVYGKPPNQELISDHLSTADTMDSSSLHDEEEQEWKEMEGREWVDLPFELQSTDAVLHVVCSILQKDTAELQEAAMHYMERVLNDDGDPLTIIRAVKDAMGEMQSRVKGFVQSMNRILDEDEDMALMNLTRLITHPERFIQPVPPEVLEEESDEPELILEAHLQIALTLTNSLDLIRGQIETVSELVDQKLDAVRNRLLLANMVISVFSLCISCASLVGSIFGMNLTNHLETDSDAFVQVSFSALGGSLALAVFIFAALIFSGTIRTAGFSFNTVDL